MSDQPVVVPEDEPPEDPLPVDDPLPPVPEEEPDSAPDDEPPEPVVDLPVPPVLVLVDPPGSVAEASDASGSVVLDDVAAGSPPVASHPSAEKQVSGGL